MRCSGGQNCGCTNFQRKKASMRCKNCSHSSDNHHSSNDDSSGEDNNSDDSHAGKPPLNAKNKQIVSSLISDLIEGGEYTGGEVERAQNEARAGLTKKHYQMKPKSYQDVGAKLSMGGLPDIKSPAKVLKIIMFPYGKKNVTSAKYPYLTALETMEHQGLVASSEKGLTFCKEWDARQMYLFFQRNLPRPFQYFSQLGGIDEQKLTDLESLPYRLLRKVRQNYSIAPVPEKYSDLTGRFYHDHATGTKGSGYKNRLIILISKKPIPENVLNDWERRPIPKMDNAENSGGADSEESAASELDVTELVHVGSSRTQEKTNKAMTKFKSHGPVPESTPSHSRNLKRTRRILQVGSSDDDEDVSVKQAKRSKGKQVRRNVRKTSFPRDPIVVSDGEDKSGPSRHSGSGSGEETERESLSLHVTKRPRLYSPDRMEGNAGLELSASVSSLHLEEAPPSVTPSNFLATWANLRKASTPFFAGGTEGKTSLEF